MSIERFRSETPPFWHEDLPDDELRKTLAFQWWDFGESLRDVGWLLVDVVRPLYRRFGIELRTDPRLPNGTPA